MVCKSCGTEGRGSFCSHCGAPLVNEAFTTAPKKTFEYNIAQDKLHEFKCVSVTDTTPQSGSVSADALQTQIKRTHVPITSQPSSVVPAVPAQQHKKRREKAPRPLVEIRMRQVFFPALVFFLPLLYLFLDVFVLYNEVLYTEQEGVSLLSLLMAHLMDGAFAVNPTSDIVATVYGGEAALWQSFTALGALEGGNAALIAPATVLVVAALGSAVCGVLVFFTAGRILRLRPIADLVIVTGALSSVAPLLADIAYRLYFLLDGGLEAADAAMPLFSLSLEAMLMLALSCALLLPATRALRRAAAGEGIYVTLPYRVLAKSKVLARLATVLVGTVAAIAPFVLLVLPIYQGGTLLELGFDTWDSVTVQLPTLGELLGGLSMSELADEAVMLVLFAVLPLMVLWLLWSLLKLLRILFVPSRRVAASKRRRRSIKRLGGSLRRIPATLLRGFVTCGLVYFLVLLLGTGLRSHLNLDAVEDTLMLLYLGVAFVKSSVRLFTVGVLVSVGALVLSTVAGHCARAFVHASQMAHRQDE